MSLVITTIKDLREALKPTRQASHSIGLVPTMGALHAGHQSLLTRARAENDTAVATIFVNPTQFDRADDLTNYPRTFDADLAMCEAAGTDIVFAPAPEEVYPQQQLTWVEVPSLGEHLCGPGRPGHFRGVATIVMKLFNMVQADRAYFGEKDAQQLAIIRRMALDLNVLTEVIPCPTVREPDGLAMSSRNKHLSTEERKLAPLLYFALQAARDLIRSGERRPEVVVKSVEQKFKMDPITKLGTKLEYFSVVDPNTLQPVTRIEGKVLIAAAMWLGRTRLIDNLTSAPLF
jgi:pantoate--beta-alanine ligase